MVAAVAELAAARGWTTKRKVAERVGRSCRTVSMAIDRLSIPGTGVLTVDRSRRPHSVTVARPPARPVGERE